MHISALKKYASVFSWISLLGEKEEDLISNKEVSSDKLFPKACLDKNIGSSSNLIFLFPQICIMIHCFLILQNLK